VEQEKDEDDDAEKRGDCESEPPDDVGDHFERAAATESSGVPHHDSGPGEKP
jgi:hypothetical protein